MPLSAEESQKLLDAIQNLNVSTEVIQEVLQLIRNAGHTGAVDIAEHDNDSNAHANVKNLCRLINGNLYLGTPGSVGNVYWPSTYPAALAKDADGNFWSMRINAQTQGGERYNRYGGYVAETTADGKAMSIADVEESGSTVKRTIALEGIRRTSDFTNDTGGLYNSLAGYTGVSTRPGQYDCAAWLVGGAVSKETPRTWFYELGPDAILPWKGITASLGTGTYPFDNAYLKNAVTVTSDERLKTSVADVDENKALALLKALRPVTFTMQVGKSEVVAADEDGNPTDIRATPGARRHAGLIAQEVRTALEGVGEDPAVNGLWCLADPADPDSVQMLRYEELIAPMLKVIQMQQKRIEALEEKLK